jgi:hypothetical protein
MYFLKIGGEIGASHEGHDVNLEPRNLKSAVFPERIRIDQLCQVCSQ